ncbi:MAG: hypothetical protein Ta2C_09710 [Candidatus Endomicrobiellum trichonymphae]|nr:hypothetical protein [Candidatus Endomicrobium trichonymphae]GMO55191.1 MAG: hypothetical protein Ta2C_09710 [Candidatus Endomicrobium trichonymphae]
MLLALTGGLCTIEISRADVVGIRIIGNSEVLCIYKEKIKLKRMIILRLP